MSGYQDWIGRGICRSDTVSDRLVEQFRATLPELVAPDPVPPGLFWALAPETLPTEQLGRDGHSRLGQFLPDLPLTRRMWAGGEVAFNGELRIGDVVEKDSRIASITQKTGSTG
ncbi:MAG: MaoC family dehydratase N-terminal domain-containing protein, partial [Cypionkella sp.]|nr:MaoC family dehydratase N-terminal domain-containing protein [Cypionkella sp.]